MSIQLFQCKNKILKSRKQRFGKDISTAKKVNLAPVIKYMPLEDSEFYRTISI